MDHRAAERGRQGQKENADPADEAALLAAPAFLKPNSRKKKHPKTPTAKADMQQKNDD